MVLISELDKVMISDGKFTDIVDKVEGTIGTLTETTDAFEETTQKLNVWVRSQMNFSDKAEVLIMQLEEFRDMNGSVWDRYRAEMEKSVNIVANTSTTLSKDLENINQEFYDRLNDTLQNLDGLIQRFMNGPVHKSTPTMKHKRESFWIPYADLMTVLMVIFLFIALAYMGLLQEKVGIVEDAKRKIYTDLKNEFGDVAAEWNLEVNKDLSIRFNNADGLFAQNNGAPTRKFISILNDFIPKYLAIITKPEYKTSIQEVRIEGHTANGDYRQTVELSQQRANSVLFYLTRHPSFTRLTPKDRRTLEYTLTTSGYGWSRALDADGNYSRVTRKEFDVQSRRVEFRIVTDSDRVIEELKRVKL